MKGGEETKETRRGIRERKYWRKNWRKWQNEEKRLEEAMKDTRRDKGRGGSKDECIGALMAEETLSLSAHWSSAALQLSGWLTLCQTFSCRHYDHCQLFLSRDATHIIQTATQTKGESVRGQQYILQCLKLSFEGFKVIHMPHFGLFWSLPLSKPRSMTACKPAYSINSLSEPEALWHCQKQRPCGAAGVRALVQLQQKHIHNPSLKMKLFMWLACWMWWEVCSFKRACNCSIRAKNDCETYHLSIFMYVETTKQNLLTYST